MNLTLRHLSVACELRELTLAEVKVTVSCEEEDTPPEEHFGSGDEQQDKEACRLIREQYRTGNPWAWCCVVVTVAWKGFSATDTLGCCSYGSEEEFREDPHSQGMQDQALLRLNQDLQATFHDLSSLVELKTA